ncbi:unnamed protein product [Umbelopsis ramanniana]
MMTTTYDSKYVLVTGGAGYIGSHTVVELLEHGQNVVVVDNLYNASYEAIRRIEKITGKKVHFFKCDILNLDGLRKIFNKFDVWSVIHFAGLKAVGESTQIPLAYYRNSITGTLNLLQAMNETNVKNFVFSSSATVYGNPPIIPIPETSPIGSTNPYGRTKTFIEQILMDLCAADPSFNAALLRYFNPAGAHPSGLMGESPNGVPNNLMPFLSQVAIGKRDKLRVFGDDYATKDGTAIRDYIHVVDVSLGHLAALEKLKANPGCVVYNLGSGEGSTVLEMIHAMNKAVGRKLPYELCPRRPGDVTNLTADPSKANKELNWKAEKTLDEMCVSLWNWQTKNPNGFEGFDVNPPAECLVDNL